MKVWLSYLAVMFGGGLGSCARFTLAKLVPPWGFFPVATFISNAGASLLVGVFLGILTKYPNLQPEWRYLVVIGFCGGFSTFSTFTYENAELLKSGQVWQFLFYTSVTLLTTLSFQLLGLQTLKWILQPTQ